ncbi:hypothetical protein ABT124_38385 [Streptomyces sp. NPDC001982]|uniref:hypothetical protein n=1 Tax=Streptomyces sp. NPDC001982 TaxID=3154405 RepID=UPI00331A9BA0
MRNVQKIAAVAVATCGILFAGIGGASADPRNGGDHHHSKGHHHHSKGHHHHSKGDNIPVLSNINQLNWDDSPFCGIQVKTKHSKQKTSCPVVHNEGSTNSPVYIFTFGS